MAHVAVVLDSRLHLSTHCRDAPGPVVAQRDAAVYDGSVWPVACRDVAIYTLGDVSWAAAGWASHGATIPEKTQPSVAGISHSIFLGTDVWAGLSGMDF